MIGISFESGRDLAEDGGQAVENGFQETWPKDASSFQKVDDDTYIHILEDIAGKDTPEESREVQFPGEDPEELQVQINAIRGQLGLPLETVQQEQGGQGQAGDNKKQESQEGREEEFKENDLIIPDDDSNRAQEILRLNNISASLRKYIKRTYTEDGNSWSPGENVLSVFDPVSGEAASFEYTKQVRELLESHTIATRHGKSKEQES